MSAKAPPLERYIRILEVLAALPNGVGAGELASVLDLPRPTIHRLLGVLLDTRLVEQTVGNGYQLTDRVRHLAVLGLDERLLTPLLGPILKEVAEATSMTAYIGKIEGHKVVSLMMEAPEELWRAFVLPGRAFAPHAAAGAKAILAYQPESLVRKALVEGGMAPFTRHTHTAVEQVLADLAAVRQRGYATCIREIDEELFALAVPIFTVGDAVVMSLGITAPLARQPVEDMAETARHLAQYAERMGLLLRKRGA